MTPLTPAEAAYIAGFIDGEGCFNVLKTSQRFLVELIVGQVDKRPLEFLQRRMGGHLHLKRANPKRNQRPIWHYALRANFFSFFVPQLLPYLILKRRKAEIALELRARIDSSFIGRRLPQSEIDARADIVARASVEQRSPDLS